MHRHRLIRPGLCLALVFAFGPARADDDDHDRARGAVERGEALSLTDVLARVKPRLGGEIVGVGFERERGRWFYEFKVVTPDGKLRRVHVDAASGKSTAEEPE